MKRNLCFLVVLLLVGAVAAFANGKTESTERVSLSLYNYADVTSPDYDAFKELYTKFQQQNPNIEITVQNMFNEPFFQKLQAMSVAGDVPDVLYLWPGARTGFVTTRGLVKDLGPFLGSKKSEFLPAALPTPGPKGELWELPKAVPTATTVVFTNDALLKKLGLTFPKTIADLIAQGPAIRAAGLTPIAMADKDGWQLESCLLSTLVGRLGGNSWINDAVARKGASFTDRPMVDSLQIVKQMTDAKLFPEGIITMEYDQALQMFEQQKAVYLIDGDWRIQSMEADLTPDFKANISLNTFPEIPNEVVKRTISNTPMEGYGMNAKLSGAKAAAAWKWIWFVAGPEGAAIGFPHGLISAYMAGIPQEKLGPLTRKLLDFYKNVPGTQTVLDAIMDTEPIGILNPGLQQIALGQKTPQQVAQEVGAWYANK